MNLSTKILAEEITRFFDEIGDYGERIAYVEQQFIRFREELFKEIDQRNERGQQRRDVIQDADGTLSALNPETHFTPEERIQEE